VTLKRQKQLFAGKASTAQALDEAQAKQGVSSANVETGKAKITSAEADLTAAALGACPLRRGGHPEAGQPRRPGAGGHLHRTAPLFSLQKLDTVRVFADVPEASAAGIRPGLPADVKLYGPAGVTVHGTVTRIATALDPATRTMRVEIDLPNPGETLLPGMMYAQVTLGPEPKLVDPPKP
jgi:multidrug efflux pump subunit AcrA (membrane-fusion protein)